MARPKKKDDATRHNTRFPTVRCTEQDLASLKRLSTEANLTLSAYIRETALTGKVVVKKAKNPIDFNLLFELNKIGVNLNQLTKKANLRGEIPKGIQSVYQKIEDVLDAIINDKSQMT